MQICGTGPARRAALPLATLAAMLLAGAAFAPGIARAEDKDAHALAQRFSEEAKPALPAAPAIDEAAERRRKEAAARQEAAQQAAAEAKRKAAEAKRRADAARRAAQQARIDEQDMLARARAEAAERAAEERMFQAEIDRREAERAAVAAEVETRQLDAQVTPAEREAGEERLIEAAKAADAARKAMEDAREDEARRLADKLKLAQERRAAMDAAKAAQQAARQAVLQSSPRPGDLAPGAVSAQPGAPAVPAQPADVVAATPAAPQNLPAAPAVVAGAPLPPPAPPGASPVVATSPAPATVAVPSPAHSQTGVPPGPTVAAVSPPPGASETRVTVLILMQPGDRGIRRTNKTADPVLCLGADCYVSNGADADAKHVTRWQALGTFNTLGGRAGACNHSLGCVFRNVDLGAVKAMLQPIDLKIMHHDRRETREVRADPTCEMVGPRLTCSAGIKASDYRMWIVPESVARRAGPSALEGAVRSGLLEGGRV